MNLVNSTLMLNNGNQVHCTWLDVDNKEPLLELSRRLEPSMVGRHRQDITNPSAMSAWLDGLAGGRLAVLTAQDPEADGHTAGYVYLQKGRRWSAHMGQVEAYVHPDYRNLGLGSALLRVMADYAEGLGLMFIKVELPAERRDLIAAYKRLGFYLKAILEDYRVDRTGKPYDVIMMIKRISLETNQEFLYSY